MTEKMKRSESKMACGGRAKQVWVGLNCGQEESQVQVSQRENVVRREVWEKSSCALQLHGDHSLQRTRSIHAEGQST